VEQVQTINQVRMASVNVTKVEQFDYNSADDRIRLEQNGNSLKNYTYFPRHKMSNDGVDNFSYYHDGTIESHGQLNSRLMLLVELIESKKEPRKSVR
jgi:hypothetical protein